VDEKPTGQVNNLQCLKWTGSVNSPFWEVAIQLKFLINGWCAAHSRTDFLRAPTAALADYPTVNTVNLTDRSAELSQ